MSKSYKRQKYDSDNYYKNLKMHKRKIKEEDQYNDEYEVYESNQNYDSSIEYE